MSAVAPRRTARLRANFGLNPAAPRTEGELSLAAEAGDYAILRNRSAHRHRQATRQWRGL
jgi:hypothetical protein